MTVNDKLKIIVDGTVLEMATKKDTSRTGIYFVIKNLCDSLILNSNIELKIALTPEAKEKLSLIYKNDPLKECFDLKDIRFGEEKLNFLMPFHTPTPDLYKIPNVSFYQLIYDFSFHKCPELKDLDGYIDFEKQILDSLNSKTYALCISKKTKKDLLTLSNFPNERTGVFYLGVKNEIIKYNDKFENSNIDIFDFLKIPKNSKYLLCLSTLEPRKNLKSSIETFRLACESLKSEDLFLVIAGTKGWGNVEEFIKDFSPIIKKKIILTGYMNDKFIPSLYQSALCLLYPSFYEGFGLPPLEAMAFGTPVIISDRGSLPEIFNSITQTYNPYDTKGMSESINQWYLNPNKRLEESPKLKEFAKKFTWKKSATQVIDFIKKNQ
jgi:glycosyltransferase involved in cell wall biosynthesis